LEWGRLVLSERCPPARQLGTSESPRRTGARSVTGGGGRWAVRAGSRRADRAVVSPAVIMSSLWRFVCHGHWPPRRAAPRRAGRGQVDWPVSRGQPGSAVKSGARRPAPTMTAATCQTDRRRRTPSGIVVRHLPLTSPTSSCPPPPDITAMDS